MKQSLLAATSLVVLALLTGCETTGLSRRERSGITYANLILGLGQGEPQPMAAKSLRTPIRLSVAQVGETAPSNELLDRLAQERDIVAQVVPLPMPGAVPEYAAPRAEARPDADPAVFSAQMDAARNLARSLGADYLFLFGGNIDSYTLRNAASILDITIVGAAVLPGARVFAEGKAAGALVETESGRIVFQVNADAKQSALSPTHYTNDRRQSLQVRLREELAASLGGELVQRLRDFSANH